MRRFMYKNVHSNRLRVTGYHVLSLTHCRHTKIYMLSKYVFSKQAGHLETSFVGLRAFRHLVGHKYLKIFQLIPHV